MQRWRDRLRWRARAALAAAMAMLAAPLGAHAAEAIAVDVVNASVPTLCVETDNVYLKLTSGTVRSFAIEAIHPAYAGTIVVDRTAPDFRNCDMSTDPVYPGEPRRVTIYETADLQLVGHAFSGFWRPAAVPVRVGTRVETGLHLLQLYREVQGPHRGSAGGLPGRRLLAGASAAADPAGGERLRLVIPARTGRDRGAALRRHHARSPSIRRRARSASPSRAAARRTCASTRSTRSTSR